jgi:hypothetical protein
MSGQVKNKGARYLEKTAAGVAEKPGLKQPAGSMFFLKRGIDVEGSVPQGKVFGITIK